MSNTTQQTSDIAYPLAKGISAPAAVIAGLSWGDIASILAAAYTILLIGEWLWKKLIRPMAERRGWRARPQYKRRSSDLVALALAAVLLLAVPQPTQAEETVTFNGVALVLTDEPCALPLALAVVNVPEQYYAGTGTYNGKTENLCWSRESAPGALCIVDEGGRHVDIPLNLIRDESI